MTSEYLQRSGECAMLSASCAARVKRGGTVASVRSWFPWDDEIEPGDTPHLEVYETDPEILAVILEPDGHPIAHLADKAPIPVGFAVPGMR